MDNPICTVADKTAWNAARMRNRGKPAPVRRCVTVLACLMIAAIAIPTDHSFGFSAREKTTAMKAGGSLKATEVKQLEKALLVFTNKERTRAGLQVLENSPALNFLARGQSKHMCDKNTLKHESDTFPPGWRRFRERLELADLKSGAENVAYRTSSPEVEQWAREVVEGWMKSPPHKKNLLNANFLYLGVGIATCSRNVTYATQVFSPYPGRLP